MARFSFRSVGLILLFVFLSSNFPSEANVAPRRSNAPDQIKSLDSVSQIAQTQIGSWECVGANLPDPCRNTLNSVDMVSTTAGWAVGEKGTILNWDGTTWQKRFSPTLNSLKSVALVSASLGWSVGENGVILQWNGSSWVQLASPTTQTLYVVKMFSATDGFAAGDRDTLLHWDGSSWTIAYFGNNPFGSIRGLAVLGINNVWAGGSAGWVSHWNGSIWDTNGGGFSNSQITSLSFLTANEGWAVGNGSSGAIYRYKDGVWTDYSPPQGPVGSSFYAVKMISSSDVWMAGVYQGKLGFQHWNGASWTTYQGPTAFNSFTLSMISVGDGWAVGEGGQILRFTNGQWSTIYAAPQYAGLNSVSMLSATDGWAVGYGSMGAAIAHWDGTTWNTVPLPSTPQLGTLFSVKMFSSNDGWAVGDGGTILRYSSGTWGVSYSNNAVGGFQTIDGISSNDLWVANGYISALGQDVIMHWNGVWNQTFISLSDRIDAIKMVSVDEGWAVGQNNVVIHRIGNNWSRYTDPNVGGSSIDMISSTDGWIAGGNNFYHWNGTSWTAFPYPTGINSGLYPLTVKMNSSSDVWAMGTKGTIFHWDGSTWIPLSSLNSNHIRSISKAVDGSFWAVGEYGVSLRLDPLKTILNVPSFKQGLSPYNDRIPSWEGDEYDDSNNQITQCPGSTIAGCGCALTSLTMILDYYGITSGLNGEAINPGTLNTSFRSNPKTNWNKDNIPYIVTDGYNWADIEFEYVKTYTQKIHQINSSVPIIEVVSKETFNSNQLKYYLDQGLPVLLKVNGPHWVVVKGYTGNQFIINDPIHNDPASADQNSTLDQYGYTPSISPNSMVVLKIATGQTNILYASSSLGIGSNYLILASLAPNQILVTDPLGRRTGYDQKQAIILSEIPQSGYYFDEALSDDTGTNPSLPLGSGVYIININKPIAGSYKFEVAEQATGDYVLALHGINSNAVTNLFQLIGPSRLGVTDSFNFIFTPDTNSDVLKIVYPSFLPLVSR